jgi:RND family efflux transporter MFP subunit
MPLDSDSLGSLRIDRSAPASGGGSGKRLFYIAGAAVLVVAAGVGLWLWLGGKTVEVNTVTAEAESTGPSLGNSVLNASGYVVARRQATVSAKVTGKIEEIYVEEGMAVQKNQVLARLDPVNIQTVLTMAQRELEASRRNLAEIEVRLADARRTLQRNEALVKQQLISESALDTSRAEVNALAARLEASRAQVKVAESQLDMRQIDYNDLQVRAPFAGVVISKDAQPGEIVSPMSAGGGFTRTGIATIVDMDSREVEVDVNEAYINRVKPNQRIEATLDAYPDQTLPAHVINLVPTADRTKATVRVRIGFDKLEPQILPEMGIKVRFLDDAPVQASNTKGPRIRVPTVAIQRDGSETFVWVVNDGRVERRAVTIGPESEGNTEVLAGVTFRRGTGLARGAGSRGRWQGQARRRQQLIREEQDMAAVEQNKTDPIVARLRGVAKQYQRGAEIVPVLEKLDLDLPRGDFVALMGPSGSGKTTLLNLLGGLDRPTTGSIEVEGLAIDRLSDSKARTMARRQRRFRVPDVQPAAGAHRRAQRRTAAAADAARQGGPAQARAHRVVAGGTRRSHETQAQGTLGWTGAARRHRARHRDRPDAAVVRRAHR